MEKAAGKIEYRMNYAAAPSSGISASLRQATGYQSEYLYRPKGRGIYPSSASGGLKYQNGRKLKN